MKKKRILIYTSFSSRSVAIETKAHELVKQGNKIFFLTTTEPGDIHSNMVTHGVTIVKNSNSDKKESGVLSRLKYYYHQINFLRSTCKELEIDLVFSHLAHANLIAVLTQYFASATTFVVFRHHFKFNAGYPEIPLTVNKNESRSDLIINRLAKLVVVPSSGVYDGMLKHENIEEKKLRIIPYIYDFNEYGIPDSEKVLKIRQEHVAKLLLLICSRMVPFKRHQLVFEVVEKLVKLGMDVKLMVLDTGPLESELKEFVRSRHLENNIIFVGFTRDFYSYMGACDFLVHPSLTEASSNTVKEFGMLGKSVAVCSGVGDFNDYIDHKKNGYLLPIPAPELELENLLIEIYNNPDIPLTWGKRLRTDVLSSFDTAESTMQLYKDLIETY